MRVTAPSIPELRIQRYQRWMLLWLRWFAGFLGEARAFAPLSAQAAMIAHNWLDGIEWLLVRIVIIRAAPRVRFMGAPKHSARRRKEAQHVRAIIGSALRRALRPKDLSQRIAALSQSVEELVARLLKRLPRGLTRRRPHRARPEVRQVVGAMAYGQHVLPADTS